MTTNTAAMYAQPRWGRTLLPPQNHSLLAICIAGGGWVGILCRANTAHVRQSGLGFEVTGLRPFAMVPSLLGSGQRGADGRFIAS